MKKIITSLMFCCTLGLGAQTYLKYPFGAADTQLKAGTNDTCDLAITNMLTFVQLDSITDSVVYRVPTISADLNVGAELFILTYNGVSGSGKIKFAGTNIKGINVTSATRDTEMHYFIYNGTYFYQVAYTKTINN